MGLIQFATRLSAEVESRFTSVERLNQYARTLKSEGEFETKDKNVIKGWPQDGSVVFQNVSVSFISFKYQFA